VFCLKILLFKFDSMLITDFQGTRVSVLSHGIALKPCKSTFFFLQIDSTSFHLSEWVKNCYLTSSEQMFSHYYDKNKLHFDEMMSVLYYTNILTRIFVVLGY
jgi:hypothetical protein